MDLEVHKNNKGRGVYARRAFSIGETIEICPTLLYAEWVGPTPIDDYCFVWKDKLALLFGYGSLYNHSYVPNAAYERDYDHQVMLFKAILPIEKGDEVTINYNGVPQSQDKLWFDPL
jgi:uncharacterized protein